MSSTDSGDRSISRRDFITAAAGVPLAAAVSARGQVPTSASEQPNILIIQTDQLAQKAVGSYGNRDVATPNMDRVAGSGVRFSKVYTTCPLCQPARASFWTSKYPSQTGVNSNGLNYPVPEISSHTPTVGSVFSKAGYETIHFGKQHDAGSLRGFKLVEPEEVELEAHPAYPVNYDSQRDEPTTRQCVEYLRGEHNRPFIAVASLNNPHNICGWVGENEGPHEDVPLPEGDELPPLPDNHATDDLENRPLPVQYICCTHRRLRQATQWNESNWRHYLAAYYHYTEMVDAQIGRILDALYSTPAGNNTLVVFMSDHGDGMGAHGMATKQVSFYEEVTRVPLMFAGPGISGRGRMLNEPLVSLLDLAPTLFDYANLNTPDGMEGISLMSWLRGEDDAPEREHVVCEWHTEWGYTVSPGRMLRTERFKYTNYLEGNGEELYDLENDPGEKRNLARDSGYRDELERHRMLLREHVREVRDPYFGLGVQVDERWRSHEVGYENHTGPCAPEAAWAAEEKGN